VKTTASELKCRACSKPTREETSWVLDRKAGAHRRASVSPQAEAFTCARCLMAGVPAEVSA
jgi:hypothetical protein